MYVGVRVGGCVRVCGVCVLLKRKSLKTPLPCRNKVLVASCCVMQQTTTQFIQLELKLNSSDVLERVKSRLKFILEAVAKQKTKKPQNGPLHQIHIKPLKCVVVAWKNT